MASPLPRPVQLKLDQTLAQWRQWRCEPALRHRPELAEVLTGGISNTSVRVTAEASFVVRIDGVNPTALGLNRQAEVRALKAASQRQLAPVPRYFNPELGSLVSDFLTPEESPGNTIAATARLLRDIHQLPALHHKLDLRERLLRYEKQLARHSQAPSPDPQKYRSQVLAVLACIEQQPLSRVLCHNDLLRANRLFNGGRLWAIDWEYCAMGSHWFDLAVVVVGDELSPAEEGALVQAYLGRTPQAQERADLRRHCCVYRYLELLWYAALERADATAQDQRLEQLGRELQALATLSC